MTTSTSGGSGTSSRAGLRAKFALFIPQAYPRKILGAFGKAHEARQNKTRDNVEGDWRIVHYGWQLRGILHMCPMPSPLTTRFRNLR